jgi:putative ABC transport system ATP-binding protein
MNRNQLALLRRQSIGFIFQAYNLIPVLSVEENISFPLTLMGVGQKEIKERTACVLKDVGLEGMEKRRPKEMSGGQQQRVAIARALLNEPAVILADEPTGQLDSNTGKEIMELFKSINKDGTTIILVTHDAQVAAHARRRIFIHDGYIVKDAQYSLSESVEARPHSGMPPPGAGPDKPEPVA